MKNRIPLSVIPLLSVSIGQLSAQETKKPENDEDTFLMTPFLVSGSSSQSGFAATATSGGTRIATDVLKAPMSIVSITEEFRKAINAADLQELAKFSAGIQPQSRLGSGGITIRGRITAQDTYRDGIPRNAAASEGWDHQDLALIERVEIIKGPAGSIYGSHNSGGLVNFVSKVPKNIPATEVSIMMKPQHSLWRAELDDTRPLGSGWAYRLSSAYQEGKSVSNFRDDNDALAVALAKKYKSLNLLVRYSREFRDSLFVGGWFVDVDDNFSRNAPVNRSKGEDDGFSRRTLQNVDIDANLAVKLGGNLLNNRIVYRYTEADSSFFNYQGTVWRFFNSSNVQFGTTADTRFDDPRLAYIRFTRAVTKRDFFQRSWNLNYDAVLDMETGPIKHRLLAYGTAFATYTDGFVQSATYSEHNPIADLPLPSLVLSQVGPWLPNQRSKTNNFTYAYAFQDILTMLNERLTVVVGARYDDRVQDNYSFLNNAYISDDKRTGTSRKLGILGNPYGENLTFYYNFSETFSPGTFNQVTGAPWPNIESINNEVGIKYMTSNKRLMVTAAGFNVVTENSLVNRPQVDPRTGALITVQTPAGETRVKGWELDFNMDLTNGLTVIGGVSKISSVNNEGVRGRAVPFDPSYKLFGRYAFQSDNRALKGIWVSAGADYVGERPGDVADTFTVPPATLVEAAVGWSSKRYSFQLNVKNVFDEKEPYSGTTRSDIQVTPEREYAFTARMRF